jgi:cytidylate kinase
MNPPIGLNHCLTFINAQLQPPHAAAAYRNGFHRRAITISRQTGSGGHTVAAKLVELLQAQTPPDQRPWTVFDRNLVEKVLEDHHLSTRLARFMPEDRIGEISDTIDELFGLHPPSWTLVRKSADTILRLAELGNVILIGRAANVITRRLDYVFHVRLVGSLERRVTYIQEVEHLDRKSALVMVDREDLGRRRYLKKYFNQDIDDSLLYHIVINTDLVPYEEAAHLMAKAVTAKVEAEAVP